MWTKRELKKGFLCLFLCNNLEALAIKYNAVAIGLMAQNVK